MPRQLVPLAVVLLAVAMLLHCGPSKDVAHENATTPAETVTLAQASTTTPKTRVSKRRHSAPPVEAELPSNQCEGLVAMQVVRDGKPRTVHRRDRYVRTRDDRRRTKDLIRMVAREMGVRQPEFFVDLALHESTWNPHAVHILNPDEEANRRAWSKHTFTRAKEEHLQRQLDRFGAQSKEHYAAKSRLARILRFRDNPYWYDELRFPFLVEGGPASTDQRSVWSFGYGLYGHNAVLYMPYWEPTSPPWVLCSHEGVVATIIEVWAARKAAADCAFLTQKDPDRWGTDGGSYRGALRRLARGHCGSERLGGAWQKIMSSSDVPWSEPADFGDKFSRKSFTPAQVLEHMLERAEQEGLLRTSPLVRRDTYPATVVVHRDRPMSG